MSKLEQLFNTYHKAIDEYYCDGGSQSEGEEKWLEELKGKILDEASNISTKINEFTAKAIKEYEDQFDYRTGDYYSGFMDALAFFKKCFEE